MKKMLMIFGMVTLMNVAYAGAPRVVIQCSGEKDTPHLTYVNLDGEDSVEPIFLYSRLSEAPGGRRIEANRRQIDTKKTLLGTLVSVQDEKRIRSDGSTEYVTVVVPDMRPPRLGSSGMSKRRSVPFKTVVIETIFHTFFGGPVIVQGPVQSSTYFNVSCTATFE